MKATPRVVLISGRLGTGTEALLHMLSRLGFMTVNADDVAHRLTAKGTQTYEKIVERVGRSYLDASAELDRFRLSQAARTEPRLARDLSVLTSSAVHNFLEQLIKEAQGPLVFIHTQSPGAYGARDIADQVWLATAGEDWQVSNLIRFQGWRRETARLFVRSQPKLDRELEGVSLVLRMDLPRKDLWEAVMTALRGMGEGLPTITPDHSPTVLRKSSEVAADALPPDVTAAAPSLEASVSGSSQAKAQPITAGAASSSLGSVELRMIARRVADSLLMLLSICFLTAWGLTLAQYGRDGLPVQPLSSVLQAVLAVGKYIAAHTQTYYWAREQIPWLQLVGQTLGHSAVLLLLAMGVALLVGLPLGILAARSRNSFGSATAVVISVLGASTPSFLFAMLLWIINIWVHRTTGMKVLPATGFGWDGHLLMPVLVLAMRPLTQIAQITYVTLREALRQDYVRTAYSKGLAWGAVLRVHLLRNLLIPILNTLGSSVRFSLASLPIVEVFFRWPGVGSTILDAINAGTDSLVMDLTLSLGLFFLVVNLALEFCFPLIDPRLRSDAASEARSEGQTLGESVKEISGVIFGWFKGRRERLSPQQTELTPPLVDSGTKLASPDNARSSRARSVLGNFLRNPVLILGSLMISALVVLALIGGSLDTANAFEVHGVMAIDGTYAAPPFKPSSVFPWGTDQIGRDLQALLLAGAGRTLSLAFFGMLARLMLGAALGIVAGWQRGGWFDRLVSGAIGTWAAFPATIFAMLVIQALGIQQGMWVFVVAISVVGWGEVAQFVRGQVIALAAQPFIESARAVGSRVDQILMRHIFPNLVNHLVVLAALEMGGILMLLAELGYLNIFMGGGFRVMTGESGSMAPIIAHYSDVPEWSALIANVRDQWRSYTWMALYPGMAILLAIISFNLFGEGLRRFLEESAISLSRFFNRRSLVLAAGLGLAVALVVGSSTPLTMYRAEGLKFDETQVLKDIRVLSSPELQGRETGTAGADLAAIYIAQRMAQIGIFPAGEHNSYFQRLIQPRLHLQAVPTLALLNDSGGVLKDFTYRQDFSELANLPQSRGQAQGRVMGVAFGPIADTTSNGGYGLGNSEAIDHVIIVRAADLTKVVSRQVEAVLVVAEDTEALQRRDLFPYRLAAEENNRPYLWISADIADRLLRSAGSSLAALDAARSALGPGQIHLTAEGDIVRVSLVAAESQNPMDEAYTNVIGVIPGQGHFMGMEDQIIVVSAYYDGVGTDPQGVVYPGANDNASGVAMLLELARLLKSSQYQPDKTVLFVAWAGGERQEGLSTDNILNARPGSNEMTVQAVIELSGVGAGTGTSATLGNDSSYRLVQLFQKAAARYSVRTTTRGRGPHYRLPTPSIYGGREAMTLSLSWDGADHLAHTPEDSFAAIDPSKIRAIGQPTYLTLLVLSRETEY